MKHLLIVGLMILSVAGLNAESAPPEPKGPPEYLLKMLLAAVEINYYDKFISEGDKAFQKGITRDALTSVYNQLGPRLKKGYHFTYLVSMKQGGYEVHLWKLEFKDGGDDILAKLAWKDHKVSGFWLQ